MSLLPITRRLFWHGDAGETFPATAIRYTEDTEFLNSPEYP
jgi:hypothetical protein